MAFEYTTLIEKYSQDSFDEELQLTLSGYGAVSGTLGGEWDLAHFENLPVGYSNYQVLLIFKRVV